MVSHNYMLRHRFPERLYLVRSAPAAGFFTIEQAVAHQAHLNESRGHAEIWSKSAEQWPQPKMTAASELRRDPQPGSGCAERPRSLHRRFDQRNAQGLG